MLMNDGDESMLPIRLRDARISDDKARDYLRQAARGGVEVDVFAFLTDDIV
jgi:hypothetical protein